MPGIQCLAIRRPDMKRCDLVLCEAELLGIVEVVIEGGVDFVGVEGAGDC